MNDRSAWTRAFATPPEPLVSFPGAAGEFFGPAFTRDSLIAIQGPEKRGKTFWCMEIAMRALRARRKVAMFEVGDLSESQIMLRIGSRLTRLPLWRKYVGDIDIPSGMELIKERDEEGRLRINVEMERRSITIKSVVSKRACVRACRRFMRGCGIPPENPYMMMSVHPNTTINVQGIEGILQRWEHEKDFVPDVIIIDYADILAPENNRKDERHQINDTWKALRKLSQEWHCLVVAPTQANAAAYKTGVQTMSNFSEDKRKLAHVTGMFGLNQTDDEKEEGIMRLNWIVLREHDFNTTKCLYVGQCLPLARPFCCSAI
jgi:replicative DNA helicase